MASDEKTCTACEVTKTFSAFYRRVASRDGYQHMCKQCQNANRKQSYAKDRGKTSASQKVYRQTEKSIAYRKTAEFCERSRVASRLWNRRNKKRCAKRLREWQKNNPERVSHYNAQRRARIAGVPGKFTQEEWEARKAEYNNRCAYCGKKRKLARHHLIPLIIGAASSNTIENIVPACGSCNSKIGTKIIYPGELCCA